ncbi:amino acid transporter [Kribbella sandramycini]|uniref:Amino acid transporter n=1 Tax=Kribbella sandramycini TaxID=60450 RepID=A0A7Y4KZR0_9ACTN|nr:LysE/ArgO family amino acid transporter [Kribbella sandramycini]MBB6565399.1 L-lysine exporter family protein LysE/ArgO [Kribbella sandramycini]NOL41668.1 amino acid transporter [Kribbella sandramycini]
MTALTGFATTLGLIVALGAQNAFVLRQGLRREHVVPIVLVCAFSDALLISAGIAGLGVLITQSPLALTIAKYAGAAFLYAYAALAARRALAPTTLTATATHSPLSLRTAVLTCLAFTYLNPHVYLDTVVLLGSLANQHGPSARWLYALGSVAASFTWFTALGFLSRHLSPLFTRPRAWQLLDTTIALLMTTLATYLLLG